MDGKGIVWVYRSEDREKFVAIFKRVLQLQAYYTLLEDYYEQNGKYPLNESKQFISRVMTFWVDYAKQLKLKREEAFVLKRKDLSVGKKLAIAFKLYYTLMDKLEELGITAFRKKPERRAKVLGDISGRGVAYEL